MDFKLLEINSCIEEVVKSKNELGLVFLLIDDNFDSEDILKEVSNQGKVIIATNNELEIRNSLKRLNIVNKNIIVVPYMDYYIDDLLRSIDYYYGDFDVVISNSEEFFASSIEDLNVGFEEMYIDLAHAI